MPECYAEDAGLNIVDPQQRQQQESEKLDNATTNTNNEDNSCNKASEGSINTLTSTSSENISPFNPTCKQAQETIIRLLELNADDILFDLGCGDARLLQSATQAILGLRCVGIDIDPVFTQRAVHSIQENLSIDQQQRIQIREESLLQQGRNIKSDQHSDDTHDSSLMYHSDNQRREPDITIIGKDCKGLTLFDDATAVYLYLLPKALLHVKAIFDSLLAYRRREKKLKKFQIVTYMFQMHGWTPCYIDRTTKAGAPIYLYRFFDEDNADKWKEIDKEKKN